MAAGSPVLGLRPHARALGPHLEDPESGELDLFALLQGHGHQFEDAFDQLAAVLARQPNFLMDRFAEVRPRDCRALHRRPIPRNDDVTVP